MIGKAIYSILSNDAGVTALVGTKIYPDIIPLGTAYPATVYSVVSTTPTNVKDGASTLDATVVQVDIYSDDYSEAQSIASAIRTALDTYSGTVATVKVDSCRFAGESTGRFGEETLIFWISQDYNFRIKR